MIIVGIDPGKTTGFVVLRGNDESLDVVSAHEIVWDRRFDLLPLIAAHSPNAVVVESFHLYAHRAQSQINNDFPSVRVIGIVETACYLHGLLDRIHYQSASMISKVAMLHSLPAGEHCKDAYKHARLFFLKLPPNS